MAFRALLSDETIYSLIDHFLSYWRYTFPGHTVSTWYVVTFLIATMFITVFNTIMFFTHCTPINIRWYPWIYRMPGMIVLRRCRHYDECTSIQCQPVIAMLFVRTFSTREWLSVTLFPGSDSKHWMLPVACCLPVFALPPCCSARWSMWRYIHKDVQECSGRIPPHTSIPMT